MRPGKPGPSIRESARLGTDTSRATPMRQAREATRSLAPRRPPRVVPINCPTRAEAAVRPADECLAQHRSAIWPSKRATAWQPPARIAPAWEDSAGALSIRSAGSARRRGAGTTRWPRCRRTTCLRQCSVDPDQYGGRIGPRTRRATLPARDRARAARQCRETLRIEAQTRPHWQQAPAEVLPSRPTRYPWLQRSSYPLTRTPTPSPSCRRRES